MGNGNCGVLNLSQETNFSKPNPQINLINVKLKYQPNNDSLKSEENILFTESSHSLQQKIKTKQINYTNIKGKLDMLISSLHSSMHKTIYDICQYLFSLLLTNDQQRVTNLINASSNLKVVQLLMLVQTTMVEILNKQNALHSDLKRIKQILFFNQHQYFEEILKKPTEIIHKRYYYNEHGEIERSVEVIKTSTNDIVKIDKIKIDQHVIFNKTYLFKNQQDYIETKSQMLFNWYSIQSGSCEGLLKLQRANIRIDKYIITEVIMQYCPGITLKILIDLNSIEDKFGITNQIIKSVKNLHSQNLIHGDIKPHNFIVSKDNQVTLIDLDTVTKPNDEYNIDYTHIYCPFGIYQVPSFQSDIWAMGLTIYQLFFNQKIHPGWDINEYKKRDKISFGKIEPILNICLSKDSANLTINEVEEAFLSIYC